MNRPLWRSCRLRPRGDGYQLVDVNVKRFRPTRRRPQRAARTTQKRSPLLVVAGAATAGAVLARAIDWRSHAHPR
jgi:hypothetical protein